MDSQKRNIIIYDMEHGTKFLLRVSRELAGEWTPCLPLHPLSPLVHPLSSPPCPPPLLTSLSTSSPHLAQASKTLVRDKWLGQSNDLIKKAKAAVANTLQIRARTCEEGGMGGGRTPAIF